MLTQDYKADRYDLVIFFSFLLWERVGEAGPLMMEKVECASWRGRNG